MLNGIMRLLNHMSELNRNLICDPFDYSFSLQLKPESYVLNDVDKRCQTRALLILELTGMDKQMSDHDIGDYEFEMVFFPC